MLQKMDERRHPLSGLPARLSQCFGGRSHAVFLLARGLEEGLGSADPGQALQQGIRPGTDEGPF